MLTAAGCLAASMVWAVAPASALTFTEARDADTVFVQVPRVAILYAPHELGSKQVTSIEHAPGYPINTTLTERQGLNAAANQLGADISTKEDALTSAISDERERQEDEGDLSDCFKLALLDMLFDAGWDTANGYTPTIGSLLQSAQHGMGDCIAKHFGMSAITAENVTDYLAKSLISYGAEALRVDSTTAAFADWAGVTAWYSIK